MRSRIAISLGYLAVAALFAALGLGAGHLYQNWIAPSSERIQAVAVDLHALGIQDDRLLMLSLTTCPACRDARSWLQENEIEFLELAIDTSEDAVQIANALGVETVPVFVFGGRRMTGFNAARLGDFARRR